MEVKKYTKEAIKKWAEEHGWLLFAKDSSSDAQQEGYLTPAGHIVTLVYDTEGFLINVLMPVPMPMFKQDTPIAVPRPNLPKGFQRP